MKNSLQNLPPIPTPSPSISINQEPPPPTPEPPKPQTPDKRKLSLILGGVGFVILVIIIGATYYLTQQKQDIRKKAAPATSLSFTSSSTTPKVGETFTLNIITDTGTNTVSAAEILIKFDPSLIKVNSITAGDFFVGGNTISDSINNNTGTAQITLLASPTNPISGTGTVAVINATTLKAGSNTFSFDQTTKMSGVGEGSTNIINRLTPLTITINTVATTTPTNTPTITPTTTPTSTPTDTPTTTPTTTPVNNDSESLTTSTTTPTNDNSESLTTSTTTPTTLPESGVIDTTFIIGSFGLAAFIIPFFFFF